MAPRIRRYGCGGVAVGCGAFFAAVITMLVARGVCLRDLHRPRSSHRAHVTAPHVVCPTICSAVLEWDIDIEEYAGTVPSTRCLPTGDATVRLAVPLRKVMDGGY